MKSTTSVKVAGRYSNLRDQGERIQDLLEIVPECRPEVKPRTPKQLQRRLSRGEISELANQYRAGMKVRELANHFGIHRDTVSEILDREGVRRRQRGIPHECLDEVVGAYLAGQCLAAIGAKVSVDAATVARALQKAGVTLRPRRGWDYG